MPACWAAGNAPQCGPARLWRAVWCEWCNAAPQVHPSRHTHGPAPTLAHLQPTSPPPPGPEHTPTPTHIHPLPPLQPLDALGTVLEGGLLGASDTSWIAGRAFAGCALSLAALAVAAATHQGLPVIWLGMKLLNLAALGLDLVRYLGLPAKASLPRPAVRLKQPRCAVRRKGE